jgi:hypothetical protein
VIAKFILGVGLVACVAGTVRAIAVLPAMLHDAGIVIPVVWQDVAAKP